MSVSKTSTQTVDALEAKLQSYFTQLSAGKDVSPADRYRLEGYLQACLAAQLIDDDWVQQRIAEYAPATVVAAVAAIDSDAAWRLPLQLPRAPVYPSSKS